MGVVKYGNWSGRHVQIQYLLHLNINLIISLCLCFPTSVDMLQIREITVCRVQVKIYHLALGF